MAIALLFGAGAVAAGFAFLANMLVDLLYGFLGRRNWPAFFIQVLVGVLAVLVAACVHAIVPGADSSAAVVAVIMMMLADMTSTGAVQDLMTGWHLTGLGRLTEGVMNTIGLIVGIRVTILTLDALGLRMIVGPDVSTGAYPLWLMCIISAGVALAFAGRRHDVRPVRGGPPARGDGRREALVHAPFPPAVHHQAGDGRRRGLSARSVARPIGRPGPAITLGE